MTLVVLSRTFILGEDALGSLADLDSILIVILCDLLYVDGFNISKSIVNSDLAVVGIFGLEIQSLLVLLLGLGVVPEPEVEIALVEVVDIRLCEA